MLALRLFPCRAAHSTGSRVTARAHPLSANAIGRLVGAMPAAGSRHAAIGDHQAGSNRSRAPECRHRHTRCFTRVDGGCLPVRRGTCAGSSLRVVGRRSRWRPQRDSKTGPPANHRRNLSAKRTKTTAYAEDQATGSEGSRRSTGTVRGQSRDSRFHAGHVVDGGPQAFNIGDDVASTCQTPDHRRFLATIHVDEAVAPAIVVDLNWPEAQRKQ
jgi:hypothetical protein